LYAGRPAFEQGVIQDGHVSPLRAAELSGFALGIGQRRQLLLKRTFPTGVSPSGYGSSLTSSLACLLPNVVHVAFYEAAGRVKSRLDPSPPSLRSVPFTAGLCQWGRSREILSAFYSRSSRASPMSPPAHEGIRGVGAPVGSGRGELDRSARRRDRARAGRRRTLRRAQGRGQCQELYGV